jgi:hypothetical protein
MGQAMKRRAIILQSVRIARFGDVTVLGSQYRDQNRVLHWVLAVIAEQNTNVRIYRVSGGELPTHLGLADRDAVVEAISLWESSPASQPN